MRHKLINRIKTSLINWVKENRTNLIVAILSITLAVLVMGCAAAATHDEIGITIHNDSMNTDVVANSAGIYQLYNGMAYRITVLEPGIPSFHYQEGLEDLDNGRFRAFRQFVPGNGDNGDRLIEITLGTRTSKVRVNIFPATPLDSYPSTAEAAP